MQHGRLLNESEIRAEMGHPAGDRHRLFSHLLPMLDENSVSLGIRIVKFADDVKRIDHRCPLFVVSRLLDRQINDDHLVPGLTHKTTDRSFPFLFVIVIPALCYDQLFVFHCIDKSVLMIYPPAPESAPSEFQRFGLADSVKGISQDISDQRIHWSASKHNHSMPEHAWF